jgi:preprotein translocase subunit SecA
MVQENAQESYDRREAELTPENMREIERRVVLSVLDRKWREHLYEMDYLREGIGLRAMAQRDPLVEYQREGYDMFNSMMDGIREESVGNLFNLQIEFQENPIVEEVGAGAQLAFGGNLPGVTAVGAQQAPAGAAQASAAPAAPARAARPVPPPPVAPAAPPAAFGRRQDGGQDGGQQPGGRSRGRHAADGRGHATAAGRGEAATRSSTARAAAAAAAEEEETDAIPQAQASGAQPVLPEGLQPRRPRNLQYTAPSETGGIERHGDSAADPYASVGRNDLCPCGSGRKYKRCHGSRS